MALSDLFGINSTAGSGELKKALDTISAVQGPTAEQLTLPELQQYLQQGLLTPEQYKAIIADPETYSKVISATNDQSGTTAQKAALQQLGGVVQAGGSTPINEANLRNNINTTNQAMQAARSGIMENAQERNVSGGGLEFINQLMNEQGNAQNANMGAVNAGANNARLALDAMTQQGQLGGQLQGQSNQMSQAQAEAAKQIAEYNSQLQSQANQYNTSTTNAAQAQNLAEKQRIADTNTQGANARSAYNVQVPETIYNNAMQKAGSMADIYAKQGKLAQDQATNQSQFLGGILGSGAKLGAAYMTGGASLAADAASQGMPAGTDVGSESYVRNSQKMNPYNGYAMGGEVECYAEGGEVHDHSLCMKAGGGVPGEDAPVPGDSEANDTVPAMLSPHEIVLPRSVAQAPDAPQQAANFVQGVKGQQGLTPTVGSFAEVLKMLEANGLELRLTSGS